MQKIVPIICALCTNVLAQISLRKGMINIDISHLTFMKLREVATSLFVWTGLGFYAISFILYLYILSKFEVSYIYPIIMSIGFVLLFTFSVLFLNESFTFRRILGIIIISAGISIMS